MVAGSMDKYVLAILFDIKERSTMYGGRAYCTVCERGNVQGTVPFRCRLSARMNKPGRQTRSSIQERHEGMPTGIYTRLESLQLCF